MAIMDERLEFLDANAINTGGAGTYLLGDVIDLEIARDIGNGRVFFWCTSIDTLPVSATGLVEFYLASDAQAAIATDGSASVHAKTGAFLAANLPVGKMFVIPIPMEGVIYERYVGILQVVTVAAFSAGKINSWLSLDPPTRWKAYADATN